MREEEGSRDRREAGEKMGMNVGGLLQEGGGTGAGQGGKGGRRKVGKGGHEERIRGEAMEVK